MKGGGRNCAGQTFVQEPRVRGKERGEASESTNLTFIFISTRAKAFQALTTLQVLINKNIPIHFS